MGFDLKLKMAAIFGLLWMILSVAEGAVVGMIPGLSAAFYGMGQAGILIFGYINVVIIWIIWLGFNVPKMVAKQTGK